jgi:hypothetical protein
VWFGKDAIVLSACQQTRKILDIVGSDQKNRNKKQWSEQVFFRASQIMDTSNVTNDIVPGFN